MQLHGIDIPQQEIAAFCRRHRIRAMALTMTTLTEEEELEEGESHSV